MTIKLSLTDFWDLFQHVDVNSENSSHSNDSGTFLAFPKQLGKGYCRNIELRDGLSLSISNHQTHERLIVKHHPRKHPVEFGFHISGYHRDEYGNYLSAGQNILVGGLEPGGVGDWLTEQQILSVNIHVESQMLGWLLDSQLEPIPLELKQYIEGSNERPYFSIGTTTPSMQLALHQILNCPFGGATRRIYFESKILELIALKLEQTLAVGKGEGSSHPLNSVDIERIRQAKDVLLRHLDNPPSLLELARQVGLNDCTLKRGFRQVFGTTAFGYLHNQRLEKARQLLEEQNMNITEVAHAVGFASRSYFAAAFRKKFGLNPSSYLAKRRSTLHYS